MRMQLRLYLRYALCKTHLRFCKPNKFAAPEHVWVEESKHEKVYILLLRSFKDVSSHSDPEIPKTTFTTYD